MPDAHKAHKVHVFLAGSPDIFRIQRVYRRNALFLALDSAGLPARCSREKWR